MRTIGAAALFGAMCYGQAVTIVNSGSTNTAGFEIVVEKSGRAEYTAKPRRVELNKSAEPKTAQKTIPKELAKSLYDDVRAALPLGSLPEQRCMKSASFGTKLTVRFGEDTSPDLSCGDGGDAKLAALIRDTQAVVKIFTGD